MSVSLDDVPGRRAKEIVAQILASTPSQRVVLITSLDARVRPSTLAILFDKCILPDDARAVDPAKAALLPTEGCVSVLLANPERCGPYVRSLTITDPTYFASLDESSTTLLQFDSDIANEGATEITTDESGISPIPSSMLFRILSFCPNLEELLWHSSTPPPDGICEVLGVHNPKIHLCSFSPPPPILMTLSNHRLAQPRWDAPSLTLLSILPLTTLHVKSLTQSGARCLSALLNKMVEYSNLEEVSLDFLWLDDPLCESLALAGRKLRRLKLGTSGTKLTDKGIVALIESCGMLEELSLVEVQGRLSRSLWAKVTDPPSSLRKLCISMSESGPHHSWTADHLQSISSLPMDAITNLSIVRSIHHIDAHVDDIAVPKPVPPEFLERLKEPNSIKVLECDWWAWKPLDLKEVLEDNPELEVIQIALDAPISKIFALANVFANMLHLRTIRVSIPMAYAPGVAVIGSPSNSTLSSQVQPIVTTAGLITPASSPITMAHAIGSMSKIDSSPISKYSMATSHPTQSSKEPLQTPPTTPSDVPATLSSSVPSLSPLTSSISIPTMSAPSATSTTDPSLPSSRDVLKFARRCPKLEGIEWYGRNGRGSWLVTRDAGAASSTTLNSVKVDYVPASLFGSSPEVMERVKREEDARMWGWAPNVPRIGHEWTGTAAEAYIAQKKEEAKSATASADRTSSANMLASNTATTTARLSFAIIDSTVTAPEAKSPKQKVANIAASPRKKNPTLRPINTSTANNISDLSAAAIISPLGRRKQSITGTVSPIKATSAKASTSPTKTINGASTPVQAPTRGDTKRQDGKSKPRRSSNKGGSERTYYKSDVLIKTGGEGGSSGNGGSSKSGSGVANSGKRTSDSRQSGSNNKAGHSTKGSSPGRPSASNVGGSAVRTSSGGGSQRRERDRKITA